MADKGPEKIFKQHTLCPKQKAFIFFEGYQEVTKIQVYDEIVTWIFIPVTKLVISILPIPYIYIHTYTLCITVSDN